MALGLVPPFPFPLHFLSCFPLWSVHSEQPLAEAGEGTALVPRHFSVNSVLLWGLQNTYWHLHTICFSLSGPRQAQDVKTKPRYQLSHYPKRHRQDVAVNWLSQFVVWLNIYWITLCSKAVSALGEEMQTLFVEMATPLLEHTWDQLLSHSVLAQLLEQHRDSPAVRIQPASAHGSSHALKMFTFTSCQRITHWCGLKGP